MRADRYNCFLVCFLTGLFMPGCDYESDNVNESPHTLIFPNDGETQVQGTTCQVEWTDEQSSTMRIRLLRSGRICTYIAEQVPNTSKFSWDIPDTLTEGNDYTIKVLSNEDDFLYFESERPFKILKQGDTSSFTDTRDGQVYKTVKLAGRWWMAENFNYDTDGSWCYGGINSNCSAYGRLYTITTALDACPPGWHLPTDDEWQTLEAYLGIPIKDINTTGLRGINAGYLLTSEDGLGFLAKFAGYMNTRYPMYYSLNQTACFWTSTYDAPSRKYWVRQLSSNSAKIERNRSAANYNGFSVRYIKDQE